MLSLKIVSCSREFQKERIGIEKKSTFRIIWMIIFVLVNILGFGIGGILMLFQVNLKKSIEEDQKKEEKQLAVIEELRDSGEYDIYEMFSGMCESKYQEDVDRIVEENGIEDYYTVEYEDSCAIIDMYSLQYSCDIRCGDKYLLVEKEPVYVDETSQISVFQCVAHADGYLGHPGPGVIIFGFFAFMVMGITVVFDVIWLIVLLIVKLVSKKQ